MELFTWEKTFKIIGSNHDNGMLNTGLNLVEADLRGCSTLPEMTQVLYKASAVEWNTMAVFVLFLAAESFGRCFSEVIGQAAAYAA